MDYISLQIPVSDAEQGEILTAELADYPFESFETEGSMLKAYIPSERLVNCKGAVDALLERYGVSRRWTSRGAFGSGRRSTIRHRTGSWRWS